MSTLALDSKVTHADLASFAVSRVNLKSSDVSDYREQVNRLRDRLKRAIDEHQSYNLVKMLNAGSVAKGTALRTINDMDVAIYVEATAAPSDEAGLLSWLEARLREVYGEILNSDQIAAQHHCITLSFRGSGLDVDVAPVLYEGDPNDYGYLVTDDGDRVRTSIPLHLQFIRKRKASQPLHFAQVARLVKWWIRQCKIADPNFRFKSFMAELIVAHLADNGLDCSNYPAAMETIFAYIVRSELNELISFADFASAGKPKRTPGAIQIYDPVNAQNNVASRYSDGDRNRIIEAAQDAFDAVSYARSAPTKEIAIDQWREVFGPGFSY